MALIRAIGKLIGIVLFGLFCFVVAAIMSNGASWAGWVFWIAIVVAVLAILSDSER